MAVFQQIPRKIIEDIYTHKGLYAGIVPVYMVMEPGVDYEKGDQEMLLTERNGIPYFTIHLVRMLWRVLTIFNPMVPPIYITGEIDD